MIKLSDNLMLVGAKLRSHKIRTFLSVVIPGIMFGAVFAASLVTTGALQSVERFREDSLTSRYIVSVNKAMNDPNVLSRVLRDPALIAKAKVRYEELVAKKTAEAKKLGISYNQVSDQPPYSVGFDGKQALSVNDANGITYQLLKEKYSADPAFDEDKLIELAGRYGAIRRFNSSYNSIAQGTSLLVMKNGSERFVDESDEAQVNENAGSLILDGYQMTLAPGYITDSYMLPKNAGWKPSDGTLPIILPQNRIELLLGLDALKSNATTKEKTDRIKTVQEKAAGLSVEACYRNESSSALIQQAIQQKKEVDANQSKKDYVKPPLQYGLPDQKTCGTAPVIRDVRTAAEKKQDANQVLFDKQFGDYQEPINKIITFKIVGVTPNDNSSDPRSGKSAPQIGNLNDAITTLLATNGIGQVVPEALYNQIQDKTSYTDLFTYRPSFFFGNEDNKQRFLEFSSADAANKFINEQSCTVQQYGTCKPVGRLYDASLVFSNSAAIDDINKKSEELFTYAASAAAIVALIIMGLMIGRTITDSRKETAVFRAIGFKRLDIVQIYMTYALILSVLVVVLACIIGYSSASYVDSEYAAQLSAQARFAFGDLSSENSMHLISLNIQHATWLLIAAVSAGIFSSLIPIIRNVRRNPLRDMRDEG